MSKTFRNKYSEKQIAENVKNWEEIAKSRPKYLKYTKKYTFKADGVQGIGKHIKNIVREKRRAILKNNMRDAIQNEEFFTAIPENRILGTEKMVVIYY